MFNKPKKSIKRSLLTKGFLVLLSLVILFVVLSYSWFTDSRILASASGISVKADSSSEFEYAIGFYNSQTGESYLISDWFNDESGTLDLSAVTKTGDPNSPYNLLKDYDPIDVTGDGSTLIRPSMNYLNETVNQNDSIFSYANPNVQYITFDLYFRSTSPGVDISLEDGSWVKGLWETKSSGNSLVMNNTSQVSNPDFNVSTYSQKLGPSNIPDYNNYAFSKDAIAGAVRMSFVGFKSLNYSDSTSSTYILGNTDKINIGDLYNTNCNSMPTLLWNPRGDILLIPDVDNINQDFNGDYSTHDWLLNVSQVQNNTNGFRYNNGDGVIKTSTYDHTYYSIFEGVNGSSQTTFTTIRPGDIDYNLVNNPNENRICTLADGTSGQKAIGGKYYGKVKVNIWVEGCDKEARRALSGGKFVFHLEIKGSN